MSGRYLQSEAQNLLNAIGTELCWGWSPPVNFLELLPPDSDDATPLRVLICGGADIRHIFLTLAKRRVQGAKRPIHFYLYEPNLRVHCRHLFFLHLLLVESMTLAELEDRTGIFLELYGNTMLRDIAAGKLKAYAQKIVSLIGDMDEGSSETAPFDFSEMKSKEKDFVEEQLRHWARDKSQFPVQVQWDSRLRTELAERYDNRVNIIDWDFNFFLHEYFQLVKFPEYREWRLTGNAFDYCRINPRKGFEYNYVTPNKSLAHFSRGGTGAYLGDVKNGPFAAIGGGTESPFLKKRAIDGDTKYGNGVVAMQNVRAWWYALLTGQEWDWAEHAFAWDDVKNYNYLPPGTPLDTEYHPSEGSAKFFFSGIDFKRFLLRMRERESPIAFDGAFVAATCADLLTPDFFAALKPSGFVLCETSKMIIDARAEAKEAFLSRLRDFAASGGWSEADLSKLSLAQLQPEPRKFSTEPSEAQLQARRHYEMPFHMLFRKKSSAQGQ